MTGQEDAAIARLDERLKSIAENQARVESALAAYQAAQGHRLDKQDEKLEEVHKQLGTVQDTLAQSKGGILVLKWMGFGSLGSLLAALAGLYVWVRGAP